jgi:hypothetical protein
VEAALAATASVAQAPLLSPIAETPPADVMQRLKEGLGADTNSLADAETTLQLVEAVRALAMQHGPRAVEYCVRVVRDLHQLLDEVTGTN